MFSIDKTNKIRLTKGDTATIKVEINQLDGKPYKIKETDTITFAVKRNVNAQTVFETEAIGEYIVLPSDSGLECGLYVYDIQLKNAFNCVYTVAHGFMEILGEVSDNG